MKQIFRIFAIAAVALSAAACQNDINDTIAPEGEGVSIRVTIADQTRVALGDFEEGKGYKLTFEEGDQLYVVSTWDGKDGFYFTYTKAEDDTYVFTCDTEGVAAILGTKQYIFHLGCDGQDVNGNVVSVSPGGYRCNTAAESIDGIGMVGSTSTFGEGTITLTPSPVLKFSSDYNVTFTSGDTSLFYYHTGWYWGSFKEYSVKQTGTDIYIPLYQPRENITFSAVIKGEVVKSKVMTFEAGKIYDLGTLVANEEHAVEGDTGVEITIDGTFADWANVTKIASYLPADATDKNVIKTLKAYADADNIYGYVEFAMESSVLFVATFDLDNDPATGEHNWMHPSVNGELVITAGTFIEEDALYPAPFRWASYSVGTYEMVNSSEPKDIGDGLAAVEFAVARESINTLITGPNVGLGIITYGTGSPSGMMPYDGTTLVIPVE